MKKFICTQCKAGGSGYSLFFVEAETKAEALIKLDKLMGYTMKTYILEEILSDCEQVFNYDDPAYEG